MNKWTAIFAATLGSVAVTFNTTAAQAQEQQAQVSFVFNGAQISIDRVNRQAPNYAAGFTATDGACGAACIAPMHVADGVATLDEQQVLAFLVDVVADNQGLMVDARSLRDRSRGFVPGSVSLPAATLDPQGSYWPNVVTALGATAQGGTYSYGSARALLVYDKGPSSDDAGALVRNLLAVGYPAQKIKYYRGGMQMWSVLGFNIEEGQS